MTVIIEPDVENISDTVALQQFSNSFNAPLDYISTPDNAGVFETAGLMYQQETIIGSALTYGFAKDRSQANYVYDKGFNPYAYFDTNKETLPEAEKWIRTGLFHDVVNEKQFSDRLLRLRDEEENRKRIAEGSGVGMILGMGLSLIDLSTLIPGAGWLHKGNTIAKTAKFALAGSTLTAGQEAVLHLQQDLRQMNESVFNIATAGVLGGGIGAFIGARQPGNILHKDSPNYPLNPGNPVRVALGRVGDRIADNPVIEATSSGFKFVKDSSVGAKAVEAGQLLKSRGTTTMLKYTTPVGYMLTAKANSARDFAVKLMDVGGLMTTKHAQAKASRSFEDEKSSLMRLFEDPFISSMDRFYELRKQLAALTGTSASPVVQDAAALARSIKKSTLDTVGRSETDDINVGKHYEDFEWQDTILKVLHDDLDADTLANFKTRFGDEGAELIANAAKKQADHIHQSNEVLQDLMVAAGKIKEGDKLGKEYAIAQLYDPKAVRANLAELKAFYIRKLIDNPDEDFLAQAGFTVDEFDKLGKEAVTVKDGDTVKTYTPEQGLDRRLEILEDWSGDYRDKEILDAELKLEEAQQSYQYARRAAVLAARDMRKSDTDFRRASVKEAKKILELRIAERDRSIALRKKLSLEKQEVDAEIKRQEEELTVRMNQFHDTGKWQRRYGKEAKTQVEETEELLNVVEKDPESPLSDVDTARKMLTEADAKLEAVGEDALDMSVLEASLKPVYSRTLSMLKERSRNISRQMNETERRLDRLNPKIEIVTGHVEAATDAVRRIRDGQKTLRRLKAEASKASRKAKRGEKSAKKSLKRKEGKLPVHLAVENMLDKMSNSSALPRGVLDTEVFESGRFKQRAFKYTNEERRELYSLGVLRSDLYGVMHSSYDDVANRLSLQKIFGSDKPDDTIAQIKTEYDSIIADARNRNLTPRYIKQLQREKDGAVKRAEGLWQRALGRYCVPQDPDGFLHWATGMTRAYNYAMYGTGFLLSSITDIASVALTTGFGFMWKGGRAKALRQTMKGMKNDEIRRLTIALERVLHNSRTLKINDVGDLRDMAGIGEHGSITHNITSPVTRIIQGLSNAATPLSGMAWWNTRLKALAMIEMQHNLVEQVNGYSALLKAASAGSKKAQLQVARMASIGLGDEQIARISRMMKKHPVADLKETEGLYELGMGRWLDEGDQGRIAYEDVLTALRRTANRAVMTPGLGDTPLFMSKAVGKTILQFQTYGFVSTTRFIGPAVQRMNYGDMEAVLSLGLAGALGTGVVMGKDLLRDGEVKERSLSKWAYDIGDRSGFFQSMTMPSATIYNWATNLAGEGKQVSRYANMQGGLPFVLGPTGGLIQKGLNLGTSVTSNDWGKAGEAAGKLMPYQILKQITERVME